MDERKGYYNEREKNGQGESAQSIGENLSSGAEKVERIAENNANRHYTDSSRVVKRLHEIRREKAAAERRVQLALEKQQREENKEKEPELIATPGKAPLNAQIASASQRTTSVLGNSPDLGMNSPWGR